MLRHLLRSNERSATYREMLSRIEHFVYKEHWDALDKSELRTTSLDDFVDVNNVGEALLDCMQSGALDAYRSQRHMFEDLDRYFNISMNMNVYFDDELQTHTAKSDLIDRFNHEIVMVSGLNDLNICDVFMASMAARVRRQLGESYEIVPTEWCIEAPREMFKLRMIFAVNQFIPQKCPNFGIRDEKELRSVCMREFIALFDSEHDKELLVSFNNLAIRYFNKPRDLEKLYFQVKILKAHVENAINNNPRVFFPFSHPKNQSLEYDSFPLVIRLFRDGDDQFLFAKDVENALKKATKNRKRKNLEVDDELLRVETDDEKDRGRYFCVHYADYQKLLKSLKLNDNDVNLVHVNIQRTRHRTVPIISPYGTECISAVDVFYELLGILTVEKQVWRRIKKEKLADLEHKILAVGTQFMALSAPRYFLATSEHARIAEWLRVELDQLLRDCPKAPKPAVGLETFTADQLRKEVKKLKHLYPRIERTVEYVAVQCCQLSRNDRFSPLELQMAVQNCILICMTTTLPVIAEFMHAQGRCMKFPLFRCKCRQRKIAPRIAYNRSVSVHDETMYNVKLDHFAFEDVVYLSLVDKKTNKKLVTSTMAHSYTLQLLLNSVDSEYRHDVRLQLHARVSAVRKSKPLNGFYLTADEMLSVAKDTIAKFKAKRKLSVKRVVPMDTEALGIARSECDSQIKYSTAVNELSTDCFECFEYACRQTANPIVLNRTFPKRTLFVQTENHGACENGCTHHFVNTCELLRNVEILMKENEESVSDKDWEEYNELVANSQSDSGWTVSPVNFFLPHIESLPIDLGRLHFVPKPNHMLQLVAQKAWDTLIDIRKGWWQEYLEIEKKELEAKRKAKEEREKREEEAAAARRVERQKLELKKREAEEKERVLSSDELARFIARQEKVVEGLEQRVKAQRELHSTLGAKYEKERELSRKVIKKLESEKEVHEGEMAKLRKELNDQTSRLKQEVKRKSEQIESMTVELEEVKKREQESERKAKKQLEAVEARRELVEELKTENANLVFQYGTLSSSMKAKMTENQELKNSVRKIQMDHRLQVNELTERLMLARSSSNDGVPKKQKEYQAIENENADLRRQIQQLESQLAFRFTPFRPQSSIASSSSSEILQSVEEVADECGICLNELHESSQNIRCEVCNTKWHNACLEEWLTKKAQCPVCNRSLPSPQHFPPLH